MNSGNTNPKREPLNNRRPCVGIEFEVAGHRYVAHVGQYDDGRIGEIFITGHKVGTAVDIAARDSSIAFSFAVQHGARPENIRGALTRNSNGRASGPLGEILDILRRAPLDPIVPPEPQQ